jgi:hypothetical protein
LKNSNSKNGIIVNINPIPRFALILQGNHNNKLPAQYKENATVRLYKSHFEFSFILIPSKAKVGEPHQKKITLEGDSGG